jgi:hypothetical protein
MGTSALSHDGTRSEFLSRDKERGAAAALRAAAQRSCAPALGRALSRALPVRRSVVARDIAATPPCRMGSTTRVTAPTWDGDRVVRVAGARKTKSASPGPRCPLRPRTGAHLSGPTACASVSAVELPSMGFWTGDLTLLCFRRLSVPFIDSARVQWPNNRSAYDVCQDRPMSI